MTDHQTIVAGWREWVSLPGLGVPWLKAKLDTGARSSAIHAFHLSEFEREDATWVRFAVHPWQKSADDETWMELPLLDRRLVRSSSGHVQRRHVVVMPVSIMKVTVDAEVTLSRRDEMGFRMLLGREVLRQGYLVDPSRSYLGGRPKRSVRRKNRGR
ncbi:ATP-dependent zinc protease family protein [Demetria terragena]|uniref:ATP-dependent zinc protease family protein n=1 Tax=Demetria terragena TaxID=63959 RepID=UPI000363072D|nr:RimK/LysX family protein [Demetria terragena]